VHSTRVILHEIEYSTLMSAMCFEIRTNVRSTKLSKTAVNQPDI